MTGASATSAFASPRCRTTLIWSTHGVVADRHDTSSGVGAIAWTLRNPAVDGAIVGFRSPEQVDPLIDAANLELSAQDITTMKESSSHADHRIHRARPHGREHGRALARRRLHRLRRGARPRARGAADRPGPQWADSPREVAEAADIVLTSLPNDDVVESVASGPDGLLAGLGEGKIWADMSTVSPRASREVAARVRERGRGARCSTRPVSGSVPQVQSGTLTIMVGGDEDAYERVEPVLRVLGTPTRIGENGQGLALKLAINISLAVQMLAFSEGLLLAEHEGIDPTAPPR